MTTYSQTTKSIRVDVEPIYLEEHSEPELQQFAWAYRVLLENVGKESVQLKRRHWRITDASGVTREVHGEGVVGEQPTLKPGEMYEYTSGTLLSTHSGIMGGTYQMVTESGQTLVVGIPTFSLDSPEQFALAN